MRDDPASVTLHRISEDVKREERLGLDKPYQRSALGLGALAGPAYQNKLRQEAARKQNAERQAAKERKRLEALGVASMADPELDRHAAEAGMRGDEGDGEGATLGAMMRGGGGGEGEGEAFGAGFKSGSDVLSTLVLKITASRDAVRAQREKEAEARSRVSHEKELLAKGGKQAHVKHTKA
jgi:hypothetical protein